MDRAGWIGLDGGPITTISVVARGSAPPRTRLTVAHTSPRGSAATSRKFTRASDVAPFRWLAEGTKVPTLMRMTWTWKIGRIAGIDAHVHASFSLLLAWAAWSSYAGAGTLLAALLGVVFLLAVFGSVLLHEVGHALAARHFGIRTRQILLLPIGGVAQLEGEPRTPKQELLIALAGPAVNFVIAAALSVWMVLGFVPTSGLLASVLVANLSIGLFNLLPAFPMDGGRVLRALLAERLGGFRATQLAVKIGKVAAVALGIVGLATSWMLTLVAVFVWFAADAEARRGGPTYGHPRVRPFWPDFDPRERVVVLLRRPF